jgi:hypothetical protein
MGITHQAWHRTIQTTVDLLPPETLLDSRFLCLHHFSVRGCHRRAWGTLQTGGTIHLSNIDAAWDAIASGTVNYGLFVTGDVEKLIRAAPAGTGPFNFHIVVIGSALSGRLRREIQRKITESIFVPYGANETAHVSVVDENNIGTILPGVQVKICDAAGNPVPFGETGLIRVKCDTMVTGYVDDPELSRKTFVDGWYHTNDLGMQPSSKQLVVLGRADEVLNIAGIKISPSQIVEEIRQIDGILDAIVLQAVNAAEIEVLVVAVEIGAGGGSGDPTSLINPIVQRFTSAYGLLQFEAFPRTETGKIRREAIHDAYRRLAH